LDFQIIMYMENFAAEDRNEGATEKGKLGFVEWSRLEIDRGHLDNLV